MRRLLLGLPLVVGVFFMLGAAPASATNCTTVYNDPITRYVDGGYQVMANVSHVGNCTSDTQWLQFRWSGSGYKDYGQAPGAGSVFHQAYLSGAQSDVTVGAPVGACCSAGVSYAQTCWYGGMHVLRSTFQWRIRAYGVPSWSGVPWHPYVRLVDEGITC